MQAELWATGELVSIQSSVAAALVRESAHAATTDERLGRANKIVGGGIALLRLRVLREPDARRAVQDAELVRAGREQHVRSVCAPGLPGSAVAPQEFAQARQDLDASADGQNRPVMDG